MKEHLGKKIKLEVEKKPLTSKSFAEKLGVSQQYVQAIYKKEDINTHLLKKIASILELPVIYFFVEENSKKDMFIDYKEILLLQKKILKQALLGNGLIYLEYDEIDNIFLTEFRKLKKKPSKTELGNLYMEISIGKILDQMEKDGFYQDKDKGSIIDKD